MNPAEPPVKNKGGRPPGAVSKLAREARLRAQETGELPHEILLSIARGNPQPVKTASYDEESGEIEVKITGYAIPTLEERKDAAKAGAPYFAPKISTVEVITGVSDDELDNIIAVAAAAAGVSVSAIGEGQESEAPQPAPRGRVRLREAT
jgi:hypothetical protein